MTVGELTHGRGTHMSSHEISEWRAYYSIKAAEYAQQNPGGGGGQNGPDVMDGT